MPQHEIVSQQQWTDARKDLLKKEKEFSQLRDELSQQRRDLPWVKVEENYIFETSDGEKSLADLFGQCSQLIVYHFMFDPDWDEGCKSCSLLADHYNPSVVHLRQRDVELVTISRAPLEKLLTFQKRMGWQFPWVSSFGNSFNRDYHVTFTQEEIETGNANYNYKVGTFPVAEAPGLSVFVKDENGDIFHTYSTYARGLDIFITAYNLIDLAPSGRNENGFTYSMEWVRHHDRYGDESFVDPYVDLLTDTEQ